MSIDIILILLLTVVIAAGICVVTRSASRDRQYDERQLMLRARGYRLAYTVTLTLLVALLFVLEHGGFGVISPGLAVYIVILTGIDVFAVFCILRDVFFSVGEKGGRYIALFTGVMLLDGALAVSRVTDGTITENGVFTFRSGGSAALAVCFLVVLVALVLRTLRARGEADE